MALRVLLADESSTIKKVFQLALQDFAVDVRPVNIGVDVASVAHNFKPDIIFADVLLQKKNGYDVCAELKQDEVLRSIPIVLMWSGFMELDEDKFQAAQANAQLEKPFDVAALRKLVAELVPRTQSQRLSQFLSFPKATVEAEKRPDASLASPPPAPRPNAKKAAPEEDFATVPLPKMKGTPERYRLNLKEEDLAPEALPIEYDAPGEPESEIEEFTMLENKRSTPKSQVPAPPDLDDIDLGADSDDLMTENNDSLFGVTTSKATPTKTQVQAPTAKPAAVPALSAAELERLIRAQSAEMIESVVWKVIPELAKEIIERELRRLLNEQESSPY